MRCTICPFSGLPITDTALYVSPYPKAPYIVEMAKIGNHIIIVKATGYGRFYVMRETTSLLHEFLSTHFDEAHPCIYLEDYSDVEGCDAKGRKNYLDAYLNKKNIFRVAILFNMPLLFQFSVNIGKRFVIRKAPIYTADNYEAAMTAAQKITHSENSDVSIDMAKAFKNNPPRLKSNVVPAADLKNLLKKILNSQSLNNLSVWITTVLTKKYSQLLLTYINAIDWQKPGVQLPESAMHADRSMQKVVNALEYLKFELDSVFLEKDKAEASLKAYQSRLRKLTIQLSRTGEAERRQLASRLHERIGQELFVIRLHAIELEEELRANGRDTEKITSIKNRLKEIINDTRAITFDLSPPVLFDLGIREAVEHLKEIKQSNRGIRIQAEYFGNLDQINDDIKIIAYRSISELIHNVVKHALASQIWITIVNAKKTLKVSIKDNGKGFNSGKLDAGSDGVNGFGLFDIREKVSHLGGDMAIESVVGEGTEVCLEIPLTARSASATFSVWK